MIIAGAGLKTGGYVRAKGGLKTALYIRAA
jgi:hypothetical protein